MSSHPVKLNSPLIPVFEISHQEIYISDSDTLQYAYVNPSALKNLQYTLEEIQQLSPQDINAEYSFEEIRGVTTILRESPIEVKNASIHARKDGSNYHVEQQLQEIIIEGHSYILGFVQDTTEKHSFLSQLKAITEGGSIGYWERNLKTGIRGLFNLTG